MAGKASRTGRRVDIPAVKIGVIAVPHSRSSAVMAAFDAAGFELGDVDRRTDENYPAGRLELWALARLTSGKSKLDPVPKHEWPAIDLSKVQIAKAMPAWVPILRAHGFNYWLACSRGGLMGPVAEQDYNEVVNSYDEIDTSAIWARACAHVSTLNDERGHGNPAREASTDEGLHGRKRVNKSR